MLALSCASQAFAGSRFAEQTLTPSVRIYNEQEHGAIELVLKDRVVEAIYDVDIDRFRDIRTGFQAIPKDTTVNYQIRLTASDHFCKLEDEVEEFEFPGVSLQLDGKPLSLKQTNGNSYQISSTKWHEMLLSFPTLEQRNDPFICYGIMVITAELSGSTI